MVFALLLGIGTLLVSLLSYCMATALLVDLVVRLIRKGYAGPRFWKNIAIMTIVSLVTAMEHLLLVALWALVLLLCGATSTFEDAFYGSAQNYTALGYGDFILSERWRLLGPLEAINGLLLFGLSAAVMFTVMSRLIAARLHLQPSHSGEAAENPAAGVSGSK
jgi:hypothetical protein